MMFYKEDKTKNGFMEILSIYASIARKITHTISTHYPSLKPAQLPLYTLIKTPDNLSP